MHGQKHIDDYTVNFRPRIKGKARTVAVRVATPGTSGELRCEICHDFFQALPSHLRTAHDMSSADYRAQFGNVRLVVRNPEAAAQAATTKYRQKGRCICHHCKAVFWRKRRVRKRKYCTPACYKAACAVTHSHKTCETCGRSFRFFPSSGQRYCSVRCRPNDKSDLWYKKNTLHVAALRTLQILTCFYQCVVCGRFWYSRATTSPKTCSARCRTIRSQQLGIYPYGREAHANG